MGGCAAPGCSNCTEKGFKMYRFPRDPERKKIWVENCKRTNWTPGSGAYLCEVHFDADQFERRRQDNVKKLRQDSIPTIFCNTPSPEKLKSPKKKSAVTRRRGVKRAKESSDRTEDEDDDGEIEEVVKEYRDTAAGQQLSKLKHEIESLKKENAQFEMHNKSMARVITELEKHNQLMGIKVVELEKEKKVLAFKVSDLEKLNEDLRTKLNSSYTEEQLARMDKMKQLGSIERYSAECLLSIRLKIQTDQICDI